MDLKRKDIANILGISQATVSMVLNNKKGISDKRRKEIIEKIKELNSDYMLKNLREDINNNNIGFVVYKRHGDIIDQSPFFSLIIENVNNELLKYKHNLIFLQLDKNNYNAQKKQIKDNNCKGLIIFAVEAFEDDLEIFKSIGLPFVIVDNNFIYKNLDTICVNNGLGIYKGIKHLYDLGHRKIGYIKSKTRINSFLERAEYYHKVMKGFDLEVVEEDIFEIRYSEIFGYEDMKNILSSRKIKHTAFITDNDLLAFVSMKSFQEFGYKIPDDISIVGFDDRPICLYSVPKLTTLSIPKDILGNMAAHLILDKIINHNNKIPIKIEIGVELIVRESTKKIKDTN